MRLSFKKVAFCVLAIYLGVTSYMGYLFIYGNTTDVNGPRKQNHGTALPGVGKDNLKSIPNAQHQNAPIKVKPPVEELVGVQTVDIWGKAAIGLYLWQHILEGPVKEDMHGAISIGATSIKNMVFRFRTGPWVVPDRIPSNIKNMVLVLNGREPEKVRFSMAWLDRLKDVHQIENFAVMLLGNERCENEWIKPYMTQYGGYVKMVFVVYDSPDIDNHNLFQWPLGVATYRNFPVSSNLDDDELELSRPYLCNFLGTVYPNSSREELLKIIQKHNLKKECITRPRMKWLPEETDETRIQYIKALRISDLTLCPVGMNTECYRIYEAMAMGSVPVIEDRMTPGKCGGTINGTTDLAPLRLLKQYGAPVIFVSSWSELPALVAAEKKLTLADVVQRRKDLIRWHDRFKNKMRDHFIDLLNKRFFQKEKN